jgi:S1-C subfamily serine protease
MEKRNAVILGVFFVVLFTLAIFGSIREQRQSEQQIGIDATTTPTEHLEREDEAVAQEGKDHGVVIVDVEPEGPADEAGVVRGDILLEIDDQTVENLADIRQILAKHVEGDVVELSVLHGDDIRSLKAALVEHDQRVYLGISGHAEMPPVRRVTVHEDWIPQPVSSLILKVFPESPAEEAGLHQGDVIVAIDGKDLEAEDSLTEIIAAYKPGDKITLEVQHLPDFERKTIDVELAAYPDKEEGAYLGVRYLMIPSLSDLTLKGEELPHGEFHFFLYPEGREHFRLPGPGLAPGEGRLIFPPLFNELYPFPEDETVEGVMVKEVLEGSPAENAGLFDGDIISRIDGKAVGDAKTLSNEIASREPNEEIDLTIFRTGEEKELVIAVRLGEHPEKAGKGFLGIITGAAIYIRPHAEFQSDPWFNSFEEGMGPPFPGKINLEQGEA